MSTASERSERFDARMDRLIAEQRRRESVTCPVCGYVFDSEDLATSLITYWGSEGRAPQDEECPNCEQMLLVIESVSRTYEVEIKETAKAKGE